MRAIVIASAGAGASSLGPDALERLLREAGLDAAVQSTPGASLRRAAGEAARAADVVVAAGGDGTVSAVAGALAGTDTPLGILPLGTLNHFAKDAGIPEYPEEAALVIAAGHTRRVDVGEVNGRVFVNNSSIGVYPKMVHERELLRSRRGLGKWTALAVAAVRALGDLPVHRVVVEAGGRSRAMRTSFVFVGVNDYDTSGGAPVRSRLDGGELCLWISNATTPVALARQTALGLLGRVAGDGDFEELCVDEAAIAVARRRVHVSLDGEVTAMRPPLRYRIRAGELALLAPALP